MTIVTVRPDSGIVFNGTGTYPDLADDDDGTRVTNDVGESCDIALGFADASLPAGSRPKEARLRGRFNTFGGSWGAINLSAGGDSVVKGVVGISPGGIYEAVVLTFPLSSDNDGDDGGIVANFTGIGSGVVQIAELYLDFVVVEQPEVTVDSPTGTLTETNRPSVTWSVSRDANGGHQTKYEVKVFDDATYGGGGFDPDTSTPAAESGILAGADVSWDETDTSLVNDNYRAYVRVAQTINGEDFWSDWDFNSFTVDAPLPNVPDIVATGDDDNGRISIAITSDNSAGDVPADEVQIQRSVDGGDTWENIRTVEGDGIVEALADRSFVVSNGPGAVTGTAGAGNVNWTNPSNASASDNSRATSALTSGQTTKDLRCSTFGFSAIPVGAIILGVMIGIERQQSATFVSDNSIKLMKGAGPVGSDRADAGSWPTSIDVVEEYGGMTDLWGNTLARTDITPGFGVSISAKSTGGSSTASIDNVTAHVYYATEVLPAAVFDYEVGNGQEVIYRVRGRYVAFSGDITLSDWQESDPATWTSDDYWLKHPTTPSLSIRVNDLTSYPGKSTAARQGIFQPLGSDEVIPITDTRSGATGSIKIQFESDADKETFDALLAEQVPLLLQLRDGDGEPDRWLSFSDQNRARYVDHATKNKTQDELNWSEVAVPVGNLLEIA